MKAYSRDDLLMAKKPTGNQGHYRVSIGDDGKATGDFMRQSLGATKDAIESRVVEMFAEAWQKQAGVTFGWRQNPENDVDFSLDLPGGQVKLELTELVLRDSEGNPFESGSKFRTFGQYADALMERVAAKSAHYRVVSIPTHLLIYATHWPFEVPDEAIALVQFRLRDIKPAPLFENIFYLKMPVQGPIVRCLHPIPDGYMPGFKPNEWENRGVILFDPARFELKTSGF